jgi:hypothetical protein
MTEPSRTAIEEPGAPAVDRRESYRAAVEARARVRWNAALRVVRRAHLFVGLFMTPWVFLYGVTGFLFNHPEAFSDRAVRTAGRAEAAGTALEGFPTAPELARDVVAALNRTATAGEDAFRLVDGDQAAYSRALFVTATGDGREHSVRFDPDTGEAFIRSTTPANAAPEPWRGASTLALRDSPRRRLTEGIPALLAKLGIDATTTALRNPPELICTVARRDRRWRIAYNIQNGAISAAPTDDPGDRLSTRRFLTGLHLAFTYPGRVDARWFWAIAVDAMFVAMVFWGTSGVVMWWQMKKLRGWGLATLILSGTIATLLAVGMHEVLARRL